MKNSLDLYYLFYEVANHKSISDAANSLYISQPAISFQLKKLESNLGVALFTRTKHGMVLTDEGLELYKYVKQAIDSINNGENSLSNLKNLESGSIRIGSSTTLCRHILVPHLEKFHELYPNIDISINNSASSNLLRELRLGNLDFVLMFEPQEKASDIEFLPLTEVESIFIGNKQFREQIPSTIELKELVNYPLIFPTNASSSRVFLNQFLKEANVLLTPKLEVMSYNLIVDLVKTGFGIGYVTKEFVNDEIKKNGIYEIPIKEKAKLRKICIATNKGKTPGFSTNKLVEIMKESK